MNPYLVCRAGNYVRSGAGGSPPTGLRSYEPCAVAFDPRVGAGLARPAGSILYRVDGQGGFIKTVAAAATGWVDLDDLLGYAVALHDFADTIGTAELAALATDVDSGGRLLVPIEAYTVPVGGVQGYTFAGIVGTAYSELALTGSLTWANTGVIAQLRVKPDGADGGVLRDGTGAAVAAYARLAYLSANGANTRFCARFQRTPDGSFHYKAIESAAWGHFNSPAGSLLIDSSDSFGTSGVITAGSTLTLWGKRAP